VFDHHIELTPDAALDSGLLPTCGGVYLISDSEDRLILLASCENLRRAVVHRLSAPSPEHGSKRPDLAAIGRHIRWRPTFSRFETAWAHWQIARSLDAKGYRKNLAFGPAWFLGLDLGARTPRFVVLKECFDEGLRGVGPFATRRDAERWLHMLEEVFDLCRYRHILEQAPQGQACAYFDMGKCPAPCNGSIPLEAYRRMLAEALAFSAGRRQGRIDSLRQAMQSAGQALAFERAATLRQTIELATALLDLPQYRHVAELDACRWLVIQRGGPPRRSETTTLVKPFFTVCGAIEPGEPAASAAIETVVPGWLEHCRNATVPAAHDVEGEPTARSEGLWLVAKFLFQGEKAPGLFYRFDQLPSCDVLVKAVRERFAPGDRVDGPDEPDGRNGFAAESAAPGGPVS
jgi:hypothetical protein